MKLIIAPELLRTPDEVAREDALRAERQALVYRRSKLCACGKMFVPYRSFQRYCCDAHRIKYGKSGKSSYKKRPSVERECLNPACKKKFSTNDSKRHYCCTACYVAVQLTRRAQPEERVCMNPACGKRFTSTHWSKRYCSAACRQAAHRSNQ